jgi:glycosyltransferase involved in cell wall biosynthesis
MQKTFGAVIPVKNESGNVRNMVIAAANVPMLTQIVFIDGNSSDDTTEVLAEAIMKYGDERMSQVTQMAPYNKFSAIKQAHNLMSSDNILIWDGDNTIQFNDVCKMIEVYKLESEKKPVFLVANRITKIREDKSFRVINLVGNHIFSLMTWPILNIRLSDVLSGVKIFPASLFNSNNCSRILGSDQFGDITLLSFARRNSLKLMQIPCSYKARTYGNSNISRWYGGLNILRTILHLYFHRCYVD